MVFLSCSNFTRNLFIFKLKGLIFESKQVKTGIKPLKISNFTYFTIFNNVNSP